MDAKKTIEALADRLEYFNKWRGPDNVEDLPMPNPREITIDLAQAIGILRFSALAYNQQSIVFTSLNDEIARLKAELASRDAEESDGK